jgi:hypothetical protein
VWLEMDLLATLLRMQHIKSVVNYQHKAALLGHRVAAPNCRWAPKESHDVEGERGAVFRCRIAPTAFRLQVLRGLYMR